MSLKWWKHLVLGNVHPSKHMIFFPSAINMGGKHLRDLEGTSGLRVLLINTTQVSPFQSSLAPLLLI